MFRPSACPGNRNRYNRNTGDVRDAVRAGPVNSGGCYPRRLPALAVLMVGPKERASSTAGQL